MFNKNIVDLIVDDVKGAFDGRVFNMNIVDLLVDDVRGRFDARGGGARDNVNNLVFHLCVLLNFLVYYSILLCIIWCVYVL